MHGVFGHERRFRRGLVENPVPRRAAPPHLDSPSPPHFHIRGRGNNRGQRRGRGNTHLYSSNGWKESSTRSPIQSTRGRSHRPDPRATRQQQGRQQRYDGRLRRDSDGDVVFSNAENKSTIEDLLKYLQKSPTGDTTTVQAAYETDEDGDAILTDLEEEGKDRNTVRKRHSRYPYSQLGQAGFEKDAEGDVVFTDLENNEEESLAKNPLASAQSQPLVNPFLAAIVGTGQNHNHLLPIVVRPRQLKNPFAPNSDIPVHIPNPFLIRTPGSATLHSAPFEDERYDSGVEAGTEKEDFTEENRRVINSWLNKLNYQCAPALRKYELFQDFNTALEASGIPVIRKDFETLLDLAFQTVLVAKLRKVGPEKSSDILCALQNLLVHLKAENSTHIGQSHVQAAQSITNSQSLSSCSSHPRILVETIPQKMARSTHLLQQMLRLLNNTIASEDGDLLQKQLPIEPPFHDDYISLLAEINSTFSDIDSLKEFIRNGIDVSSSDDKDAWYALPDFLSQYFSFIRDVNLQDLLATYEMLSNLMT